MNNQCFYPQESIKKCSSQLKKNNTNSVRKEKEFLHNPARK